MHKEPIGTIYPADGFQDGGFPDEICFFASAPRWLESEHIHLKPAGQYVSVLFQGWNTFREAYNSVMAFIEAHGLRLGQYVYEFDLVDFLTPEPGRSIIEMQFMVQ